jgi:hypothetical protein
MLLRNVLARGLRAPTASGRSAQNLSPHQERRCHFCWRAFLCESPATIESTVHGEPFAASRHLTLWPSAIAFVRGSKGCCSIPSGFSRQSGEADAAKTFLLQTSSVPYARLRPAERRKGRGASIQTGALQAWPTCRTGGNLRPSDQKYSTLNEAFSQAGLHLKIASITLFFNHLR